MFEGGEADGAVILPLDEQSTRPFNSRCVIDSKKIRIKKKIKFVPHSIIFDLQVIFCKLTARKAIVKKSTKKWPAAHQLRKHEACAAHAL